MKKTTCKDVNRECEYGEVYKTEDLHDETRQIETGRFGYDSIWKTEKTGRTIKTIREKQVCKYCGNIEVLSSEEKVVTCRWE